MKRYFFLVNLLFPFCTFDASAMLEDPYVIVGRYVQQLNVAATAQQVAPTEERLETYYVAAGAVEAASGVINAKSVKEAYAIADRYVQQLNVAVHAQQTAPTRETFETYCKARGATEAAGKIANARGLKAARTPKPAPAQAPREIPTYINNYLGNGGYDNAPSDRTNSDGSYRY